mgnify:CR=1 FL=1
MMSGVFSNSFNVINLYTIELNNFHASFNLQIITVSHFISFFRFYFLFLYIVSKK